MAEARARREETSAVDSAAAALSCWFHKQSEVALTIVVYWSMQRFWAPRMHPSRLPTVLSSCAELTSKASFVLTYFSFLSQVADSAPLRARATPGASVQLTSGPSRRVQRPPRAAAADIWPRSPHPTLRYAHFIFSFAVKALLHPGIKAFSHPGVQHVVHLESSGPAVLFAVFQSLHRLICTGLKSRL